MSASDWNSWMYGDPSCPKANLLYGQVGNFHMAIGDNQDLSIKNFVPRTNSSNCGQSGWAFLGLQCQPNQNIL